MIPRAKINRQFWSKFHAFLTVAASAWGFQADIHALVRRELGRARVEAYSRGFNDGAEAMRQKLSGKYGH
jgi:hypothetical protein